ncbi:glyoxalase domain-containing protein 4-like [Styela clava]
MSAKRSLHFVFKIGNRKETANFYRDVLGMKVLRHEEFKEGCKASCNGPYDGTWSKTMIGYGAEDSHFVCELTYNYGIGQYKHGNDYLGMTINSSQAFEKCKSVATCEEKDGHRIVTSPCGYKFIVCNNAVENDPVQKVTLGCESLEKSLKYWQEVCGMQVFDRKDKNAILGYDKAQAKLEIVEVGPVDHATAYGRIAIGCPRVELPGIQKKAKDGGNKILTELVSLDTPGKATVEVVILADPDGHEICFVGDEAFKELSQVDPAGDKLLNDAMEADKSDEWYAKRNKQKPQA